MSRTARVLAAIVAAGTFAACDPVTSQPTETKSTSSRPATGTTTRPPTQSPPPQPSPPEGSVRCAVTKVTDGDTQHLRCSSGDFTTRDIGIDTPETKDPRKPVQCFGPEASEEATKVLLGHDVFIRPDSTQDTRDKYGRLLVYISLPDGTDYGLHMIRAGFAREYTYRTAYKRQASYRAAQAAAQAERRGLWGKC